MISLRVAWSSHCLQLANSAAVCSNPPSEVGTGMTASEFIFLADVWVSGRKYMYICVVNRLGTFVGVIQRVYGSKDSTQISKFEVYGIVNPTYLYQELLHEILPNPRN